MSSPGVIIHAVHPEPLAERVRARYPEIRLATCDSYEDLPHLLERHEPDVVFSIRFAGTEKFPREALLGSFGPRWISVGGSGCDHLGKWNPDELTVTNSAGVAAGMMAEYVMGSILHFSLDIPGLESDRAAKMWTSRVMDPIDGKTLLVIGLGKTGQAVASRAKAFGMKTIGVRAHPVETEFVDQVHPVEKLSAIVADADFTVVCAPLLESTSGLLDARFFEAAKPGMVLVDVSRGGIVDEGALEQALKTRILKGAALDVFQTEPLPPGHPFWELDNVIVSPHCSSVYDGWENSSIDMFCDNLARWMSNEPLLNVVNPVRGY